MTNKQIAFSQQRLEQLGLANRAAVLVSGNTLVESKPHPAPLLHAARAIEVEPAQRVYVGGAEGDIPCAQAGWNEEFRCVIWLCFGY